MGKGILMVREKGLMFVFFCTIVSNSLWQITGSCGLKFSLFFACMPLTRSCCRCLYQEGSLVSHLGTRASFMTCSSHQNEEEKIMCHFLGSTSRSLHASVSSLGPLPLPWREAWASLPQDERPCGAEVHSSRRGHHRLTGLWLTQQPGQSQLEFYQRNSQKDLFF